MINIKELINDFEDFQIFENEYIKNIRFNINKTTIYNKDNTNILFYTSYLLFNNNKIQIDKYNLIKKL